MANFNLNKVILGGRLTADPELKTTPSGISVASFTIAVNRRAKSGEESTADFINVTAWRKTAEFVTQFFRKSSSICIVGSISTSSWTDKEGQKRFKTEVLADEAYFVDAKSEMPGSREQMYVPDAYAVKPEDAPKLEDVGMDGELPF